MEKSPTIKKLSWLVDDPFLNNIEQQISWWLFFTLVPLLTLIVTCSYIILEPEWTFFKSFYFTYVTLATIGFGDVVPSNILGSLTLCFINIIGIGIYVMAYEAIQIKLASIQRTILKKCIYSRDGNGPVRAGLS